MQELIDQNQSDFKPVAGTSKTQFSLLPSFWFTEVKIFCLGKIDISVLVS